MWATPGHHNAHLQDLPIAKQTVTLGAKASAQQVPPTGHGFRHEDREDDDLSFMAMGVHTPPSSVEVHQSPPIMDDPAMTAQENMDPDEEGMESSDDDSSTSEENPAWRVFYVYTVHQPPLQVNLNMVRERLQQYQCARALGLTIDQLRARYQVFPCPSDLRQSRMRGMLARFQDDPPEEGALAMALIDVEFHPPAPRWDPEIIRAAMFVPRQVTNHQFLASMHLMPYCRYNRRPCLLLLRNQRILLDVEVAMQIDDGSYIRVVLPPPNEEDENTPTRCVAMACYQGIGQEFFAFFGDLVEEHNLWSMPNPSQVLVVDSPDEDPEEEQDRIELIQRTQVVHQPMEAPPKAVVSIAFSLLEVRHTLGFRTSSFGHCMDPCTHQHPGMQATPGQHNACHPTGIETQSIQAATFRQRRSRSSRTKQSCRGSSSGLTEAMLPRNPSLGSHLERVLALRPDPRKKNLDFTSSQIHVRPTIRCGNVTESSCDQGSPPRAGSRSFLCLQRVGEASKPGPDQATPEGWAIAAINPTGLAGKAKQFSDLPRGIYAVSETHLSERGQVRFREELSHAKTALKLYPGYRAPLKKDSIQAVGGKHTGVAFLTHFPTRPIVSGWNEELYQTSRIHAAVFLVHNTWIAGGVCYGYAKDADSPTVQENTNRLLQEVARQVMQGFSGPAFIAGDFNQTPGVLAETVKWEQRGWRDVQTWTAERYGINPGVTCQFTTRKDFVYLSPELQTLLSSCHNSFDRWPDHSTLMGMFSYPSNPEPLPRWSRPAAIDYSQVESKQIAASPCSPAPLYDDPTQQYTSICNRFEQHVHECCKAKGKIGLQQSQRGRGQTMQRTFKRTVIAPVKPARQGDYQPSVHTWSLLHSRWITQCRRLQSYAKHVSKGSQTPTAVEHRAALWRAIRNALGFAGGFPQWWGTQSGDYPNQIPWIPIEPPGSSIAQHISEHFQAILSSMETRIIKQRVAQARQNRIADTNRVFKDVRRPMPVPVSMLVAKASTQVTAVVDEGSVEVANSDPIQEASVLETRTGPLAR